MSVHGAFLHFLPRFARIEAANDMECNMEKYFNVAGPCHPAKHYMRPSRNPATTSSGKTIHVVGL